MYHENAKKRIYLKQSLQGPESARRVYLKQKVFIIKEGFVVLICIICADFRLWCFFNFFERWLALRSSRPALAKWRPRAAGPIIVRRRAGFPPPDVRGLRWRRRSFAFLPSLGAVLPVFLFIWSPNDDADRRTKNEALEFARILPRRVILCHPKTLVSKFWKKIEVEVRGWQTIT